MNLLSVVSQTIKAPWITRSPDIANSYADSYVSHDAFINDYDYDDYDYSKCGGDILLDAGYQSWTHASARSTAFGYKQRARGSWWSLGRRATCRRWPTTPTFRDPKLRPEAIRATRNPDLVQGFCAGVDPSELRNRRMGNRAGFRSNSKLAKWTCSCT